MTATATWLDIFSIWVERIDDFVWGLPLIAAILATGVILTLLLRLKHLKNLGEAFKNIFHNEDDSAGEVSAFGSLCTALSATIGTGNIVGVATAIGTGGPGALFWMEVGALFGMATKYAEGLLAVKYREITPAGKVLGGPFYYIEKGLGPKWKPLAVIFAISGIGAGLLGIGTLTQVNGITSAVQNFLTTNFADLSSKITIFNVQYQLAVVIMGAFITACVALVILGGLKRIAKVSTVIVPFMAIFYVTSCLFVLIINITEIPHAVKIVLDGAFNPQAVTGGAIGTILITMQKGIARGIFSNEAGLGSAPIAAAAAKTNEPARQGLVCMTGTFIDTILICFMTGIVIVLSGAWEPSLGLQGVDITIEAFRRGLAFLGPYSNIVSSAMIMLSLTFFAFTTILGWNYYSEKCLEYLIGTDRPKSVVAFRICYVIMVFAGPYLTVSAVWGIADIMNGLMAFPNLIALLMLSPVVVKVSREYFAKHSK
jgi:AGCS family alanine or glycine:cation symporter